MVEEKNNNKRTVKEKSESFFEAYGYSASSLKQWLITFGIGVIALFITNLDVFDDITVCWRFAVFILIIASLLLQVIMTFLNKVSQYYLYLGEIGYLDKKSKKYKRAYDFSIKYYVDWIIDLLTILFYVMAVGIIIYFISIR